MAKKYGIILYPLSFTNWSTSVHWDAFEIFYILNEALIIQSVRKEYFTVYKYKSATSFEATPYTVFFNHPALINRLLLTVFNDIFQWYGHHEQLRYSIWSISGNSTLLTKPRPHGESLGVQFPTPGAAMECKSRGSPGGDVGTWNWLIHNTC